MSTAAEQALVEEPVDEGSLFDMSDEDWLKQASGPQDADILPEIDPTNAEDIPADDEVSADDDVTATPSEEAEADKEVGESSDPVQTDDAEKGAGKDGEEKPEPITDKPDADKEQGIDYKSAYEQLTAPFKANGKLMQVDNIDEALQLMKMGANYNYKMNALGPHRKILKMLDNNGLLSEEKLTFLIDLDKKNPDAIGKLLKDSGIEAMDVDTETTKEYTPTKYTVDDKELEFDSVVDEIRDTDTFGKTLDVISNKWDAASKKAIATAPQIMKLINDHVANGIYDVINVEVERQRTFGQLNGVSDLDAYKQIGDAIQSRNGFDHLFPQQSQPGPSIEKEVPVSSKKAPDAELNSKRKAASLAKPSAPSADKVEFNPLALSDEEFEKQMNPKYL